MKKKYIFHYSIAIFLLFLSNIGNSQIQTPLDIALRHIEANVKADNLTTQDIQDLAISSMHTSKKSKVTHIYLVQRIDGIEIFNSVANIHVMEDGHVLQYRQNFVRDAATRINSSEASLTPSQAIQKAMDHLGYALNESLTLKERKSENTFIWEKGNFSRTDVRTKLVYTETETGSLRLTWDVSLDASEGRDFWNIRIDALTGEFLEKNSWTVHCNFGPTHNHTHECQASSQQPAIKETISVEEQLTVESSTFSNMASAYNVFEIPLASPSHGSRTLVVDPDDPMASPFGWHDNDGEPGPEFTITRGNNVHSIPDRDENYQSDGNDPDGGAALTFDFSFDGTLEPVNNIETGTVNLFYMNNILHDFVWHYGLDEAAGNFQTTNYSGLGGDDDHVLAYAQFSGDELNFVNNADFSTPEDGQGNGRMRMFLWNDALQAQDLLSVTAPGTVSGTYQTGTTADFGPDVPDIPGISGEVAIADDGSATPTLACQPLVNPAEINGKIALVDRGDCFFSEKIYYSQEAGAIAVIVCNYEEAVIGMNGADFADDVTIPAIFISNSDCNAIRMFAGDGLMVTLASPPSDGPELRDGSVDNSIIAHEYGHGISIRLTGGALNSSCLGGQEQMGEGWSDYFGLVLTTDGSNVGDDMRPIANYATRDNNDAGGLRTFPYSTDMAMSPYNFDNIITYAVPHGVGSVWCSMLWDLFWAMTEEHGWDDDIYTGTGGNNMATHLVMEGMKLQVCNPGFVDGRDAILKADTALYNAENSCLIWETFARRGLGYGADQGVVTSRFDGTPSYESHPFCDKSLKVSKAVTPNIEAGENIEVTLVIQNHKDETATNVIVTDEVEYGTNVIMGSESTPFTLSGNLASFEIGDLAPGDEMTITYTKSTSPNYFSTSLFSDDLENFGGNWDLLDAEGTNIWFQDAILSHSGSQAYYVEGSEASSDQYLFLVDAINLTGAQPILRFWHWYDLEPASDGGVVEVSTDDGATWIDLGDKMFRKPYRGEIQGNAFGPRRDAFWGTSDGQWVETYADLTEYQGQDVKINFRFAADGNTQSFGWFVDDIELMELAKYNGEVCVTSEEGDNACAIASGNGTVVEPDIISSTNDPVSNLHVALFPNPANDWVNIEFRGEATADEYELSILDVDGKKVFGSNVSHQGGQQTVQVNLKDLARGFYLAELRSKTNLSVKTVKLVLQ